MEEITVILNGYRRPEYIKEQIKAIKAQSVKPKEIWVWVNRSDKDFQDTLLLEHSYDLKNHVDVVVDSSRNFKYHGRFALGLLAKTKYVAFFDDDTIPGVNWFKNCLDTMKSHPNSILGGAGVLLFSNHYINHQRFGWPNPLIYTKEVDLIGHAWFLERSVLSNLWTEIPCSFDNGEDIQLCFASWLNSGIKTYTPPHPADDKTLWSSLKAWEYGNDQKASSNGSLMPVMLFYDQRDKVMKHYFDKGYKPVLFR